MVLTKSWLTLCLLVIKQNPIFLILDDIIILVIYIFFKHVLKGNKIGVVVCYNIKLDFFQ